MFSPRIACAVVAQLRTWPRVLSIRLLEGLPSPSSGLVHVSQLNPLTQEGEHQVLSPPPGWGGVEGYHSCTVLFSSQVGTAASPAGLPHP